MHRCILAALGALLLYARRSPVNSLLEGCPTVSLSLLVLMLLLLEVMALLAPLRVISPRHSSESHNCTP